ncbi:MAG: hypothetical protein KatS3mg124_1357 [Porticoccaceae bacterium]|nr:MAG: hypothetical protein KatS3mg124_1357 [Porticoccaceae bacterium]
MTTFLATLLFTFAVLFGALLFFWRRGAPVYRVERVNVVRLLELVLAGRAREQDWQVFLGWPIRHDPALAEVQRRCAEIAEREWIGGRYLFSERGLEELGRLLAELKSQGE